MDSSTTGPEAYLVIDAGGTYLKSAILNAEGCVYDSSSSMTRAYSDSSRERILEAMKLTVRNGLSYIQKERLSLSGIGFSIPGPFDYHRGIPLMDHKFSGIKGFDLRNFIENIPGMIPGIPICFRHDANSMLDGEIWKGNACDFQNAALVTLGTGLGFAYSVNKTVQCNETGGPKITIFKTPCREGVLEDYVSKRGLIRIYHKLTGKTDPDTDVVDIANKAVQGDDKALRTFDIAGTILAEALNPILQEMKIQCLLFGGQISRSFPLMKNSIKAGLKNVNSLTGISGVKSIDHSALLGALKGIILGISK